MTDDQIAEILRNYDLTDPKQLTAALRKVVTAAEARALEQARAKWRNEKRHCED